MKHNSLLILALTATIVCGCSVIQPQTQHADGSKFKMKKITKAWYVTPPPVNNDSHTIAINGFQMKEKCAKTDVESQGFPEGTPSKVETATSIIGDSTPLYCKTMLVHSPAWGTVKVRIKMNDGTWSDWTIVDR